MGTDRLPDISRRMNGKFGNGRRRQIFENSSGNEASDVSTVAKRSDTKLQIKSLCNSSYTNLIGISRGEYEDEKHRERIENCLLTKTCGVHMKN